jgi:GT2 family glycosyltransferase
MKPLPFVSFVIVNYNGIQYLKECLEPIRDLDYPQKRVEIIMVDNCSTDQSIRFVKKTFPGVIVIKNDVNNYTRANNLGIRKAKGEYIAFVNNDVRLEIGRAHV